MSFPSSQNWLVPDDQEPIILKRSKNRASISHMPTSSKEENSAACRDGTCLSQLRRPIIVSNSILICMHWSCISKPWFCLVSLFMNGC
jgi:hypothetical protein